MLIDKINESIKDLNFEVSLESAIYKKLEKRLYLTFRYSDELLLTRTIKVKINEVVANEIGSNNFEIKYRKNYFDEKILRDFVLEKLRREFPFVGVRPDKVNYKKSDGRTIEIVVDKQYEEFVQAQSIAEFLQSELRQEFGEDFLVLLYFAENVAPEIEKTAPDTYGFYSSDSTDYEIELESIEPYIGELIDTAIYPIASFIEPTEGIAVCGKIKGLKANKTKAKVDENGKERDGRDYFSFDLVDYSEKMHVVYFPGKANLEKFKKLADDSEIVIFGNLEEDKFSAGLTLRPKVINICITKPGFYEQVYSLPVPKTYKKVFPEPYISTEQGDLFTESSEITNPYLLENDFVMFDLETTGVNYMSDKIIEIGAVKIVQGKLTETFGTLVNPERHIPADATKVNNITDEDVKDAPTLKEVMPDFFKFCDGCILVSYVIDFDFGFIEYHGKSLGYAFQNKTDDAFVMAKTKLKGLHNYKLTTVAKHLGVALENAHRAVFDAVAAGEVMIKLLEKF